jgi:hypothetical protein
MPDVTPINTISHVGTSFLIPMKQLKIDTNTQNIENTTLIIADLLFRFEFGLGDIIQYTLNAIR